MMMARDTTPPRPQLDAQSIEALSAALSAYLADSVEDGRLRGVLRQIAEEARRKEMHAEQLLVILKDVWFALPSIKNLPEGAEQHRVLQRIVSLCIREYYSA